MNDLEFRQQVLDKISPSFCGAKWYNATIWLGSGMTTSCHHPPAHKIDVNAVIENPKMLHNTTEKKDDRRLMKCGKRPKGCEYCWKIEDINRNNISDRVYKSKIYPEQELIQAYQTPVEEDVNLKTLEIAFDRTCQFACSYCNPAFSTTWVKDIKKNGAYTELASDGRNHFTHEHASSQLYKYTETNPYIEAFFKWWESDLHRTLDELRITGGEPLMSGHTWKLIEWFKENRGKSKTKLAINSNLGFDTKKVQEFLDATEDLPSVEIYTSCEAVGTQAEYIRDGLDYQQWIDNMHVLLNSKLTAVHSMCTINALCLESLPEYLDEMVTLKEQYGKERVNFTLNILRFPSFQSALIMPNYLRTRFKERLQNWLDKYSHRDDIIHEHEINHTQRLIDYLDVVKTPHSDSFDMPKLHNDFKHFFSQYDVRRDKNFQDTFPEISEWYNTL